MIGKSIVAAFAVVATVGIASSASAEFLETGTAANNTEGGFGGGYAWTVPHGQQILINRWPDHQRRE